MLVSQRAQLPPRERGSRLDTTHLTFKNYPVPLLRAPLLRKALVQERGAALVLTLHSETVLRLEPLPEALSICSARPFRLRPVLHLIPQ